jgi:translation initiation factor IF-3
MLFILGKDKKETLSQAIQAFPICRDMDFGKSMFFQTKSKTKNLELGNSQSQIRTPKYLLNQFQL